MSNNAGIDKKVKAKCGSYSSFIAYSRNLNAAMSMAPNAPVVIVVTAPALLVAEAEEPDEAALPVDDEPDEPLLVELAVDILIVEVAASASAVAFLVPHFSLFVQVAWPSASLG